MPLFPWKARSDLSRATGKAYGTEYGVMGFGDDASGPIAAAISAAGHRGAMVVRDDIYLAAGRPANPYGVRIEGPGLVTYPSGSDLRVLNPSRPQFVFGREFLAPFLNKLQSRTAATVRISGDSRVGNIGPPLTQLLQRAPWVTVTSVTNSGKSFSDWQALYCAADITAAADVLVLIWGMNNDSDLEHFQTSVRAGLAAYRAALSKTQSSVVLTTMNASADTAGGRDEVRNEDRIAILRQAADDFDCCFVDVYSAFQNAWVDVGANTWLDSARVHPQTPFANAIADLIYEAMTPGDRYLGGLGVSNLPSSVHSPASTDANTTYFRGVSIRRATGSGWPVDGFVATLHPADGNYPLQIAWNYSSAPLSVQLRGWVGSAWTPWVGLGVAPLPGNAVVADSLSAYPVGDSSKRALDSDGWPLNGFVRTYREPVGSVYGYQDIHAYNSDAATQRRTWSNAAGGSWGTWKTLS